MSHQDQEDKFLICFADIASLFRKSKKKILYCAIAFGLIGAFWALMKPIRYQAEGTFREKGINSNTSSTSTILQFLGGGAVLGGESEAASLMTSRKILKNVVTKLNLQANLQAISDVETLPRLIKRNIMLMWSTTFGHSVKPVLKDFCCPLKIETVEYSGELPLAFLIELQENGSYEVIDLMNSKKSLGHAKLGDTFQSEQLSFSILPTDASQQLVSQSFLLSVNSLYNTVKAISDVLKVENAKSDKNLLILKFQDRNRHRASSLINSILENYQAYQKKYHSEIAFNQLEYLGLRRDELTKNLTQLMENHADYLTNDIYNSGFIESEKEMEFLARNQYEYKRKLLDNELEIKRLTNIKPGNLAHYDSYSGHDDSSIINPILSEIRTLKQQRDSLGFELQKKMGSTRV